MADESEPSESNQPEATLQFRLSTIFVLTLIASLLAAFLRPRPRGEDMMLAGLVSVAIGGALMAVLIEWIKWIERKKIATQPLIGFMLVLGAIGFSWFAAKYIPGW